MLRQVATLAGTAALAAAPAWWLSTYRVPIVLVISYGLMTWYIALTSVKRRWQERGSRPFCWLPTWIVLVRVDAAPGDLLHSWRQIAAPATRSCLHR